MKNQNECIKRWGIISLLSILGLELLLDNIFVFNPNTCPYAIDGIIPLLKMTLFVIFFSGLILSIIFNWSYIGMRISDSVPINGEKDKWKKMKDILKTLIKNSVSGNILDLMFVIFFLFHLTWIPDSIFDFIKKEPEDISTLQRVVHPFIYITGLIGVIFLKPYIKKEESKEPLVIITGISFISKRNMEPFIEPLTRHSGIQRLYVFVDRRIKVQSLVDFDKEKEYYSYLKALFLISNAEKLVTAFREKFCEMEDNSKLTDDCFQDLVGRGIIKSYRLQLAKIERFLLSSDNIGTIETALKELIEIVKQLDKEFGYAEDSDNCLAAYKIFRDKSSKDYYYSEIENESNAFFLLKNALGDKYENVNFFPYNDTLRFWIVKEYIKDILLCIVKRDIEIHLIECDYDEIPQSYFKISNLVNELSMGTYRDENLLFNITPGTANLSVALALNSIKGNRLCSYKEQNGKITESDGRTNKEFREINLNIYDLKDVFSELTEG